MVVVDRLVGMFDPDPLIVALAQASSPNARTKTPDPVQAASERFGRNGDGTSQPRASPETTARAHATGGRTKTPALSGSVGSVGAVGDIGGLRSLPSASANATVQVQVGLRSRCRIWILLKWRDDRASRL